MKKPLLLLLAGLAGSSALMADNPTIYDNAVFQGLSPDNRYIVSNYYSYMEIFDLETGKTYEYSGDEGLALANGNALSSTGIIIASLSSAEGACYWKDGEWHHLPVLDENMTNVASGITKDGTRICGNLGNTEISVDAEVIMQVPYYWDLLEDGTYSAPKPLPHPELDYTGRVPQYITATCISDDGKTILGQIQEYSGMGSAEAIIYTQNEDGEWSYSLPTRSLINPNNVELPEYPGEFGESQPDAKDFLSEEELEAYNAAYEAAEQAFQEGWQDYVDSGYDFTKYPSVTYPQYADFMTPEEKAEYDAAMGVYSEKFDEWNDLYMAYTDALWEMIDSGMIFEYNSIGMSGNGKYIIMNISMEDPDSDPWAWPPSYIYTPVRIELANSDVVKYEGAKDVYATQVFNDGRVVVKSILQVQPVETYISDANTSELTPITDYIEAKQPTIAAWMRENMTHSIEKDEFIYDEDGNVVDVDITLEDIYFPGRGFISEDETLFVSWTENSWDEVSPLYIGYKFDLTKPVAGVANVAVDENALTVKVDAEGTIYLSGKAAKLEIFDLNGRCVRNWDNPSAATTTLLNGLYIVKATAENGTATVVKAAL